MSAYCGFIIPECYIDTRLTQFLLKRRVNHQHSCNNVVKVMRTNYDDDFAVGIIDNDKAEVAYLQEFQKIGQTKHLKYYIHNQRKQFIITVSPAMDGFVMDCAKEMQQPLSTFGLPERLKDFTHITKDNGILKDNRITCLLTAIQNHGEIVVLKSVLEYLLQSRYNASSEEIKALIR